MFAVLISTYNVKNLFLTGEGPTKPAAEVRPLLRMIDQVAAQVMVLQEVGSRETLVQLNSQLAQPYPHLALLPGNSRRSIHIALLSRFSMRVLSHRSHRLTDAAGKILSFYPDAAAAATKQPQDLVFARDLVQVEIALSGQTRPLTLFCVHLKSRMNSGWQCLAASDMREAECRAMANMVSEYQKTWPQARYLILGDFNDLLSSEALAPLAALSMHDPLGEQLRRSGRNPSTYWSRRRTRIDHILVSQSVLPHVRPDSAKIHVSQMARAASDHYPVSLELESFQGCV